MWIIFALLSALSDAARNIANKSLSQKAGPAAVNLSIYVFSLPVYCFLSSYAGMPTITIKVLGFLAAHVVLEITSTLALTRALEIGEISVVSPSLGSSSLFILISAPFLLKESATLGAIIGSISVVIGIYMLHINMMPSGSPSWIWRNLASRLSLLVAFLWAIDGQILKMAARQITWQFLLLISSLTVAAILLVRSFVRRQARQYIQSVTYLPSLVALGLAAAGSLSFMMLAMQSQGGLVAYVVSLKRLSMLLGVIAGYFLFQERITKPRIFGCLLIFLGVTAISILG